MRAGAAVCENWAAGVSWLPMLAGVVAVLLLVYLFAVLLRPEDFL